MIWVGAAAAVLAVIAFVLVSAVQGNQDPPVADGAVPLTLVPIDEGAQVDTIPTVTLDAWALQGTALANATITPTLDYCYFLTPSPFPSATAQPITPDAWGVEGTRVYLLTGTPSPTPLPTQAPPRSWCDHVPTATIASRDTVVSETWTPTGTMIPSTTPFPELKIQTQAYSAPVDPPPAQNNPPVVITAPPVIVVQTQVVIITAPPVATNTATATPSPTATSSPTATPSPSPTPAFAIAGDCVAGYPYYSVQIANPPSDWIQWAVERSDGLIVSSGQWEVATMLTPTPLVAAAPSGDGAYLLKVFQWWSVEYPHILSAPVACIVPTSTPTATATFMPTETATLVPTETATIIPTEVTVQP